MFLQTSEMSNIILLVESGIITDNIGRELLRLILDGDNYEVK